jgi:hypothetical protein
MTSDHHDTKSSNCFQSGYQLQSRCLILLVATARRLFAVTDLCEKAKVGHESVRDLGRFVWRELATVVFLEDLAKLLNCRRTQGFIPPRSLDGPVPWLWGESM